MYILECADGSYYTGSTKDLERRLWEHQNLLGANYTKRRLPVKLVYYEEYSRIDEAFYREKQVQGWNHNKKKALIEGCSKDLPLLSRNYTQFGKPVATVASTKLRQAQFNSSATEPGVELAETPLTASSGSMVASTDTDTVASTGSATDREKGIEPVEMPCPASSAIKPGVEHVETPDTTEIKKDKNTDKNE